MKNRIRQVMDMQNMTQQDFAAFIGVSPATLSSILTGRTNATLPIVLSIKNKMPNISTDWLLSGSGEMFSSADENVSTPLPQTPSEKHAEPMLDFGSDDMATTPKTFPPASRTIPTNEKIEIVKPEEKTLRRITEIRIFYDDQTWETFLPKR